MVGDLLGRARAGLSASLVARCAPRTGRRVVLAAEIDQIYENSSPGDNRGTQRQGVKECDEIHFQLRKVAFNG